jgi:hypothetical protein
MLTVLMWVALFMYLAIGCAIAITPIAMALASIGNERPKTNPFLAVLFCLGIGTLIVVFWPLAFLFFLG